MKKYILASTKFDYLKKNPKTQCNSFILCSISQIKLFLEIQTEQFAIGKDDINEKHSFNNNF